MRFRRCRFVPQLDVLARRIVPNGGGLAAAVPTIAPDDSQGDDASATDPGYGDPVTDAGSDGSNDGSVDSGDDSDDTSATDDAIDGLYGGSSDDDDDGDDDGDDSDYDPDSTGAIDDSGFTVAVAATGVSAY